LGERSGSVVPPRGSFAAEPSGIELPGLCCARGLVSGREVRRVGEGMVGACEVGEEGRTEGVDLQQTG
jgi:hypothetical protein